MCVCVQVVVFCQYPFVLDSRAKAELLRVESRVQMHVSFPFCTLTILSHIMYVLYVLYVSLQSQRSSTHAVHSFYIHKCTYSMYNYDLMFDAVYYVLE